jgi:hypothetical protein
MSKHESFAEAMELIRMYGAHKTGPYEVGMLESTYHGFLDRLQAAHDRELEQLRPNFATYDVLGNERQEAVCKLRNIHLDTGSAVKKLAIALGVKWNPDNAQKSMMTLQKRLIYLLGGDECNFSGSENDMYADNTEPNPAKTLDDASNHVSFGTRSDGTMGQLNGTCPNGAPTASITSEMRDAMQPCIDDDWLTIERSAFDAIADRTDEQFDRICKQYEAVLQATIDAMVDERDRLMEQRFELQQSLREVAECLDLHNMHELYGYKIDAVTKLVVGAIYKLVDERDELQTECDRLTKALDEIQAEPVNDVICRIERERDELLVKLEGYDQTHMKLPLDRKGVIVRPGDMVRLDEGILAEVIAVSEKNIIWRDGDYPDHQHLKQRVAHNVEVPRPEPDTVDRIAEGLKSGKVSVQEAITRLQDMARREAATDE